MTKFLGCPISGSTTKSLISQQAQRRNANDDSDEESLDNDNAEVVLYPIKLEQVSTTSTANSSSRASTRSNGKKN